MTNFSPASLLRLALLLDGLTGLTLGAALLAGRARVAAASLLPDGLLLWAGGLLLLIGVLLVHAATRPAPCPRTTRATIAVNLAWIAASLLAVAVLRPAPLGLALILGLAAAVLAVTAVEYAALRAMLRRPARPAPTA